jgi:hypothetical protein
MFLTGEAHHLFEYTPAASNEHVLELEQFWWGKMIILFLVLLVGY